MYVDDDLVGTLNSKIGFPNILNISVKGKVIEIRAADGQYLSLAEVEVGP